jgi:hypothetical protein
MNKRLRSLLLAGMCAAVVLCALRAQVGWAYVEIPYTLGRIIQEATQIAVLRVEKVDKTRNLILYKKVQDLKGGPAPDVVKHNIGQGGFHPREWQTIMAAAEPGTIAVFFNNGGASETCLPNYWYQAYAGGEWWNMSHAEPYFLRSFAGRPEKLAAAVTAMLAGQEVVIPCMADGDKNTLQLRTGKIQRLKASLKIQDYDAKRDFVGWGGEDFRAIAGMPGFTHYAGLARSDPGAAGVSSADFDGDGKADLCLAGAGKVSLLTNTGTSLNEVSLPAVTGARSADWADYNGDGKPDLLLAAPQGPMLFTNQGEGRFSNDSAGLPREAYYNLSAGAWLDYDGDKKPDMLLANGFLGLRLYRNKGVAATTPDPTVKLNPWLYIGPFDNAGGRGFATTYPPENEINPAGQYDGKNGEKVVWKAGDFGDARVNNLKLFKPELLTNAVVYVYRQIDTVSGGTLPVSLGSDDTLTVWLNGEELLAQNVARSAAPDQAKLTLSLKPGRNDLLLKICQTDAEWGFYFAPGKFEPGMLPLFEDVSAQVGLGATGIAADVKGDHLVVSDVDGDGRNDFLYGAGTGTLVLNTPKGFAVAKDSGIRYQPGKIMPVFGDFDGDKKPDLFVPQSGVCRLFKNAGGGRFTDVTAKSGALAQSIGEATCATWTDFNKSGKLDLLVGCLNGPNRFFRNKGNGTFVDTTADLGFEQKVYNTRGVLVVDFNKDGAPDVVFNNEGQESGVFLGKPPEKTVGQR